MIKLTEKEKILIERVSEITKIGFSDEVNEEGYVDNQTVLDALEKITNLYEDLSEDYDMLKEDIKYNYKPKKFDPYLEYGVSERDFF